MIFAIGVIFFFFGRFLIRACGSPIKLVGFMNTADYVGVVVSLTGFIMILYSVLSFAAGYLP